MSFLGDTVQNGKETLPSASLASKKLIGLYFSAHWCGPCRGFTPNLATWYKNFKASHANKDDLEIVFVSSDRDEAAFAEYYAEMPWLALPFAQRDIKGELSAKYGVQGIPTLVFVDAAGEVVNKDGRAIVSEDPKAERFPWAPKSFDEMLGASFLAKDGKTVGRAALAGKYIGLYFSAHWCPPCRGFTPELVKTYNKVTAAGKALEIVFVSSDRDEGAFAEYYAEMPWLALPYADRARKAELSSHFEVEGIPTLVILGPDGKVINGDGRSAVSADPEGADFPWEPKALNELNGDTISSINTTPLLVVLTDGSEAKVAEAKAVLAPIAAAEKAAAAAANRKQVFFMYSADNEENELLRQFASLGDANPQVVFFNVAEQYKARAAKSDVTADNISAFLHDILAKTVKKEGLRD